MIELCEELLLVHHRVHTPLLDDATLVHLLHRVELLFFLLLHLPNLAEATSTDHVVEHKVILIGC